MKNLLLLLPTTLLYLLYTGMKFQHKTELELAKQQAFNAGILYTEKETLQKGYQQGLATHKNPHHN